MVGADAGLTTRLFAAHSQSELALVWKTPKIATYVVPDEAAEEAADEEAAAEEDLAHSLTVT